MTVQWQPEESEVGADTASQPEQQLPPNSLAVVWNSTVHRRKVFVLRIGRVQSLIMHFRKQLILSIVHLDIKNIKKLLEIFQNTFFMNTPLVPLSGPAPSPFKRKYRRHSSLFRSLCYWRPWISHNCCSWSFNCNIKQNNNGDDSDHNCRFHADFLHAASPLPHSISFK